MQDFYKTYAENYRNTNSQERKEAREHWTRCHAANLEAERDDLIMFSAKILAVIATIDAGQI